MYDYKYGVTTQSLKLSPKSLLIRLPALNTHPSPVLLHVFRFLPGHELAKTSVLINRQWYVTVSQCESWEAQSNSIGKPDRVSSLFDSLFVKLKNVQKQMKSSESHTRVHTEAQCELLSGSSLTAEDVKAATWKYVYWHLLVKTCLECGQPEGKMRFTTLLQRAMCGSCRKLEKYQMVDHYTVEGLKISDPAERGKRTQ